MRVEEDDLNDASSYLALFLLNVHEFKLARSNSYPYLKEVELRLILLFQNGVLGHGKSWDCPNMVLFIRD